MKLSQLAGGAAFIAVSSVACQQATPNEANGVTSTPTSAVSAPSQVSQIHVATPIASVEFSASYTKCLADGGSTTLATQKCVEEEWKYQDARLNANYQRLKEELSEADWIRIRDEQRKWLFDRRGDKHCGLDASVEGQAQRPAVKECSLRETAKRADELERMLHVSPSTQTQPVATSAANTAQQASVQESKSRVAAAQAELEPFIPGGMEILAVEKGDINNDGLQDVVMVLDHIGSKDQPLNEGPPRSVLLLMRDASGALRKVAQNDKLVPCATCGGLAGDPFAFMRMNGGVLTIYIGGGSRERWRSTYKFKYATTLNDLMLYEVERGVVDTITEVERERRFTSKDFGAVRFKDFDSSMLPEVTLP